MPGLRIGRSAYGNLWISVGIPVTGLYFYRLIGQAKPGIDNKVGDPAGLRRIRSWRDTK